MKCNNCGKEIVKDEYPWGNGCDGRLTLEPDPFAQEIHDDHSLYWDCVGNRYESAMDI